MMDLNEGEKPCTPYKLRRIAPENPSAPVIPCEKVVFRHPKTHVPKPFAKGIFEHKGNGRF